MSDNVRRIDLAWVFTVLCAELYLLNIYLSTGIYDTSDGLAHFSIAKYAPKHPELFLDHWGKPLFTTLAAPFAQFGLKGVMVMNTLLYVLTSYLLVSLARQLNMRFTWALPVLLAAIPVYFQVVMSGLTEVLFAAVLVAGLWAFARERFMLAALIITWLPFARSEAYFVVPWFALALLFKRQWLSVALIAVGPLIMSIIGWFVFDDFLWIVNNNPYVGAKEIYGNGEFWHFYKQHDRITGTALLYAATAGVLIAFYRFYRDVFSTKNLVLVIAALSAVGIFFGHSYFWANGLYGSLGLIRVLATIAPIIVLFAVYTITRLAEPFLRPQFFGVLAIILLYKAGMTLYWSQTFAKKPFLDEEMAQDLKAWYDASEYADNPNVWFMSPVVGYYLGLDDRDHYNCNLLWSIDRVRPSNSIREGGLIIYDGARSPNEGKTSKELLFADPNLKLVHSIDPTIELEGYDNSAFEFLVFTKQSNAASDTLIFEDFNAERPILSGRLDRIVRDSIEGSAFVLQTFTAYTNIYNFWIEDIAVWQAPVFRFWYKADAALEVLLAIEKRDGSVEMVTGQTGDFNLPELDNEVVRVGLALNNTQPYKPVKVYEWGLVKLNK